MRAPNVNNEEEGLHESLWDRFERICFMYGDEDAVQLVAPPSSPSIGTHATSICYIEILEYAKALASQLHYRYRPSYVLVDCHGWPGAEIVAILACIRIQVPFVPVSCYNQHASEGRLKAIVNQLSSKHQYGSVVAITCCEDDQDPILGVFQKANVHSIVFLDQTGNMREALRVPSDLPPALSDKDDLYVFFTSGTSGKIPKGVVGPHRSTLRRIQWFQDTFQQLPKVAKRTPLTFVDSIAELLGTLLAPETVLVSLLGGPYATQLTDIGTLVQSTECCQVSMLPSQLEQLLRYRQSYPNACSSLKRIIISGEPCTENLWNAFRRAFYDVDKEEFHCQLVNLYGQTETTADCCAAVLTSLSHDQVVVNHTVTIGKPLRDDIVIEEKSIGDDPALVELVVSGASCLANGYLIGSQDSGGFGWDSVRGRRLFETGDTGFFRNGFWYVQGRKDDVVKVNGEWTNPAAVESAFLEFCRLHGLSPLPLTAASVVDDRLYIVVERVSGQASIEFSREIMKEKTRLPWNMIPHQVLECSAIPRTPGAGKVDRFQIKRLVRSMMNRRVNVGSSETTSEPNESLLLLFIKIVADVLQVPEAKVSELNNSKILYRFGWR
ncbi:non-ribosomal peptide synthetase [Nitzschia inconspicua]|uniref:Non-ribosomal peptide synthetase n=1 Tax=Nitzschia inconspicua TaxID=303405 RepID=A0A9K3PVR8_9STRA|nr:non-ribosomal peptide synthetase [Nitzschia inconspicua]